MSRELDSLLCGVKVGFCMTGSFCTFSKAFSAMEALRDAGCDILPVMSLSAGTVDTRFGTAQDHIKRAENICGKRVIMSVADAEPIGPKKADGYNDCRSVYRKHDGKARKKYNRYSCHYGGKKPPQRSKTCAYRLCDK